MLLSMSYWGTTHGLFKGREGLFELNLGITAGQLIIFRVLHINGKQSDDKGILKCIQLSS